MARKRLGKRGKKSRGSKGAVINSPFTPPMGKGRMKKRGRK